MKGSLNRSALAAKAKNLGVKQIAVPEVRTSFLACTCRGSREEQRIGPELVGHRVYPVPAAAHRQEHQQVVVLAGRQEPAFVLRQ